VRACPADALTEKSVIALGKPSLTVVTTCASCGVGCSFKAEVSVTPSRTSGRSSHGEAAITRVAEGCLALRDTFERATRRFRSCSPPGAILVAIRENATHIHKFWEPQMIQELLARIRWATRRCSPCS